MEKISELKIVGFLDRSCDADTWNEVYAWINASEETREEFFRIKKIWALRNTCRHTGAAEVEGFVRKFDERIAFRSKTLRLRRFAMAAASAAALFAVALLTIGVNYFSTRMQWHTIVNTAQGEVMHFQLDDGTKVALNKGSEIAYRSDFSSRKRRVKLRGEAYFEVTSDPVHPFTVAAGGITVRVLGTAFNVKTGRSIETTLEKGHVVLETARGRMLADLEPGQRAVVDAETKKLTSLDQTTIGKYTAWRFNHNVYEGITFPEIVRLIEERHNVTVVYDPATFDNTAYRLVVSDDESLDDMLRLLNLISPIDYTLEAERVLIKKRKI